MGRVNRISRLALWVIVAAFMQVIGLSSVRAGDAWEHKINFDIPSQDLQSALNEFALQSKKDVLFSPSIASDKKSGKLVGEFDARTGLEILLSGTGLGFRAADERTILIGAGSGEATSGLGEPGSGEGVRMAQAETQKAEDAQGDTKLEEIVVTAQKRKERLKDVPISISVLSGADLDASTAQGVSEILQRVPGVTTYAAGQGGGTQIAMRGVTAGAPLFGGASPIGYYIDTVPTGIGGRVGSGVVPDTDAYDLERIEALRGPQSTLFGANAAGGLVRILTHDADLDATEFKIRTLGSSTQNGSGNYRADAALNVPIVPGKLAARAVLGYQGLSGWIDNSVAHDTNDAFLRNYRLKVNARPTDEFSVGLSAWSSRQDFGGPSGSDDDRFRLATKSEATIRDWDAYGAKLEYNFTAASVTSQTSYFEFDDIGLNDLTGFGLPADFPALVTHFNGHILSEELLINSRVAGLWKWSLGAFYRDAPTVAHQVLGAPILDLVSTSKSYAGFGNVSRRFHDSKLEWTLGLRFFHDEIEDFNVATLERASGPAHKVSPRAVLSWFASDELMAYASYAEGFRSGGPPPVTNLGFPQLKPDTLRNYEVGAKGQLPNRTVSFDASVYYIDWKDPQVLLTKVINNIPQAGQGNGSSASGLGVDVGVTFRPIPALEIGITSSWNDLAFDSPMSIGTSGFFLVNAGDRLNLSSQYTGGLSGDYSFSLGSSGYKGKFSASANYSSKQIFNTINTVTTPRVHDEGDATLFARSSFSVVAPRGWIVTGFIDNLTNEYGGPPSGLPTLPWFYPRPRPRTYGLQFEYQIAR